MSIQRNTALNIAGSIIPLIVALVTIPLYLAEIGAARFGALALCWLFLGYFGLFDLGLGRATTQRIAALHEGGQEQRARVVWTAALINFAIGLLGSVLVYFTAGYFFSNWFEADAAIVREVLDSIVLLCVAVPIATLTGVASGALQGRERFLEANVVSSLSTVLFQVLPLLVAYIVGPTLSWLVIAAIVGRVIGLLLFWVQAHRHVTRGFKPAFDMQEWKRLLAFGGWVFVSMMIGAAVLMFDRLTIGALLGASAVAIYVVAFDIAQRTSLLPKGLAQALFPRFSRAGNEERGALMADSLDMLNLIMTPPIIAAIFLAESFLNLWVGPEVGGPAGRVCSVLLMAYWANAFAMIPYTRLQAQGRPDVVAWIIIAQTPFFLVALFFSISAFGLIGAASAVLIRCVLEIGVMLYFCERRLSIPAAMLVNLAAVGLSVLLVVRLELETSMMLIAMTMMVTFTSVSSWLLTKKETRQQITLQALAAYSRLRILTGRYDNG